MGESLFLEHFFFTAVFAHRVLLRPVFDLAPLGFLEELAVGVAVGVGKQGSSNLKIGSPSSSNKLAVSISQAGYLLEGFTFAAKFASVRRSTFSGVPRMR